MSDNLPEIEQIEEEQEPLPAGFPDLKPSGLLKLLAELVGTLGLSYTVTMTAAVAKGDLANTILAPVAVPICASAYLVLMVYAIGNVSGCHINPAVSTAIYFWQFLSGTNEHCLTDWTKYLLAQTIGGVAGGILASLFWNHSGTYEEYAPYGIYPFVPEERVAGMAATSEMMAVFFFTFSILRNCCDHDKPSMSTDGLVIAVSLFTAIMGTTQISGGCVNPAVATALRVANDMSGFNSGTVNHGEETFVFVYWAGPLVGALVATCAHYIIESRTTKGFVPFGFLHNGRPENKENTGEEGEEVLEEDEVEATDLN